MNKKQALFAIPIIWLALTLYCELLFHEELTFFELQFVGLIIVGFTALIMKVLYISIDFYIRLGD